jgi:hypothetical protein
MIERELLPDFASEMVPAVTRGEGGLAEKLVMPRSFQGSWYLTHAGLVGEGGSCYHLAMSERGAGKIFTKAEICFCEGDGVRLLFFSAPCSNSLGHKLSQKKL